MATQRLRPFSLFALNSVLFMACAPTSDRGPTIVVPALSAASASSTTAAPPAPEPAAADGFDQSTPAAALTSFARAFSEKRWDVLVRFVPDHEQEKDPITPDRLRAAWDAGKENDVAQRMPAIRRALDQKRFTREGSRAWLVYDGGTVELILESGLWKIEDL